MTIKVSKRLVLVCIAIVVSSCGTPGPVVPGRVIQEQGFKELVPPSTLVPPATFVEVRSEVPFQVATACRAEAAFGDNIPLRESTTQSAEIIEERSRNVGISAGLLDQIKADASFQKVTKINYTLTNAKVIEIDNARLFELRNNLTPSCESALEFSWSQGRRVSVIRQVLLADVTYEFEFDTSAGLTLETQRELIEGLSARLGADSGTAGERSVRGESLYWGVVDDIELACALAQGPCSTFSGSSRGADGSNSVFGNAGEATILTE